MTQDINVLEGCSKRFIVQLQNADATAFDWQGGAETTRSAVDMQPVRVSAEGAELLLPPVAPERMLHYYEDAVWWHYQLRVSFHAEDGLDASAYQMGRQCCLRVLAKDPAAPGGLLGEQGGYGSASDATQRSWVAKHTWHMQAPLFAPANHTHPGLDELLAHKDALLALVNS